MLYWGCAHIWIFSFLVREINKNVGGKKIARKKKRDRKDVSSFQMDGQN